MPRTGVPAADLLAEYRLEANLGLLRDRNLDRKRALALREYALGTEALDRFTAREPLHRVHECVFGVLALDAIRPPPP